MRIAVPVLACAALLAIDVPARAQVTADKGAALVLFDEGRALMRAGRLEEACAKLAASNQIRPAAGTLLNLGECYERRRMTASAWVTFQDAASEAERAGDGDRAVEATRRAGALEPQLTRLVVIVPPAARGGLSIRRDGIDVPQALWGSAVPVDPGAHTIDATTASGGRWSTTIDVRPAPGTVSVEVPSSFDAASPAPAAPKQSLPDGPAAQSESARPRTERTTTAHGTLAIASGALGVVGAGAGTFLALTASSQWDDARAECPDETRCSREGVRLGRQAGTTADLATGMFVTAGVFVGAAVVLWLVRPRTSANVAIARAPSFAPVFSF